MLLLSGNPYENTEEFTASVGRIIGRYRCICFAHSMCRNAYFGLPTRWMFLHIFDTIWHIAGDCAEWAEPDIHVSMIHVKFRIVMPLIFKIAARFRAVREQLFKLNAAQSCTMDDVTRAERSICALLGDDRFTIELYKENFFERHIRKK